jgi:hypothetical protein
MCDGDSPERSDATKPVGKLHNAFMRLSARADYALRAAIELAAAQEGHVTAEQLAQAQNIQASSSGRS